jgi:hypothetical protein
MWIKAVVRAFFMIESDEAARTRGRENNLDVVRLPCAVLKKRLGRRIFKAGLCLAVRPPAPPFPILAGENDESLS